MKKITLITSLMLLALTSTPLTATNQLHDLKAINKVLDYEIYWSNDWEYNNGTYSRDG